MNRSIPPSGEFSMFAYSYKPRQVEEGYYLTNVEPNDAHLKKVNVDCWRIFLVSYDVPC